MSDPALMSQIMVKDFEHFVDRVPTKRMDKPMSKSEQAWSRQLTSLGGDEWKDVRSTFSPIFTSGKMKVTLHKFPK